MADKTLTQLGQIADGDIGDSILAYVALAGVSYKMTAAQLRTEYLNDYYQTLITGGTEDAIATYDSSGSLQEAGITLLARTFSWTTGDAIFKHGVTNNASVLSVKGNGASYAGELRAYAAGDATYASITDALITSKLVRSIAAVTQDAVQLQGRAGGTGSFIGTMTTATLSASRTYTFPDASGVIAIEPGTGWVEGATNLTTQYRGVFVNAANEVTESASIKTNASGDLGVGVAPTLGKLHVAGSSYLGGSVTLGAGTSFAAATLTHFSNNFLYVTGGTAGTILADSTAVIRHKLDTALSSHIWETASAERMRLTNSALLIGATTQYASEKLGINGDLYANGTGHFGGAANYMSTAANGLVALAGTARVKKGLTIANANFGKGATAPTQVIAGNFTGWEYDISDDSVLDFHVEGDWDNTSDIELHFDWYIDEAYATASGEIQWQVEYSACPHDETEAIDAPTHTGTLVSGDVNIPATAKFSTQVVLTIPAAKIAADDQVGITLSRIALDGGTNPTAKPTIVDLHVEYIANKLGMAI